MNGITNTYIVTTQNLENYGADNQPPTQHWKYKSGSTYAILSDSAANAAAIVMAARCSQQEHFHSFPIESITVDEWKESVKDLDADYREYLRSSIIPISFDGTLFTEREESAPTASYFFPKNNSAKSEVS